ncbi:hypothetical protein DL96DRAFT_95819 [Flagelloscypha sp. PMI_526]|nr:hypothetical protein DL96DRAFT_95819 [Flagelloscypha sp. PMI_526]
MDKVDLEQYQIQLSEVEKLIQNDPSNSELLVLRSELKELIDLASSAVASSSKPEKKSGFGPPGASAPPTHNLKAGDECLAKYSTDGQWYPARITSVGGATTNQVYSIVFKGYNTTELVKAAEVKPMPVNYELKTHAAGNKRKLTKEEEDERERKKKKNEKKVEVRAQKAKEQNAKQASWQKFAKKSEKKGVHIAGVAGTSIFKSPDNPLGRVGVTGSGKGMTATTTAMKHKFEKSTEDNA